MLTRLVDRALTQEPWTNVVGMARTVLALATATTLLASRTDSLFRPVVGLPDAPYCDVGVAGAGLFCLPLELPLLKWIAIGILLVVASGWRPRITGVLHYWVSVSYVMNATMVDGGDQVAAILTLLLLPVTLTDSRRWHWDPAPERTSGSWQALARLTAVTALVLVQIQVAGIYFHATVGKIAVDQWANGTAMFYYLQHGVFGAPEWCRWLVLPLLENGVTVTALTWGVLVSEFVLSAGLFVAARHRMPILWLGVALHAGILVFQGISSFSVIMMAALILYLRVFGPPFRRPAVPSLPLGGAFQRATVQPRLAGRGVMKMRVMFKTAVLLAATVCVGCGAQPLQPGSAGGHEVVQRGAEYSGEDLFRGILFGEGEVAAQLPVMWGACDPGPEAASTLSDESVAVALEEGLQAAADRGDAAMVGLFERLSAELGRGEFVQPAEGSTTVDELMDAIGQADPEYFDRFAAQITSGDHETVRGAVVEARDLVADVTASRLDELGWALDFAIAYETAAIIHKVILIGWKWDHSAVYEEVIVNEIALAF